MRWQCVGIALAMLELCYVFKKWGNFGRVILQKKTVKKNVNKINGWRYALALPLQCVGNAILYPISNITTTTGYPVIT